MDTNEPRLVLRCSIAQTCRHNYIHMPIQLRCITLRWNSPAQMRPALAARCRDWWTAPWTCARPGCGEHLQKGCQDARRCATFSIVGWYGGARGDACGASESGVGHWHPATSSGKPLVDEVFGILGFARIGLRSPEQLRHTKTPRLTLAQVGPRDPQSAQRLFASCLNSWARMRLCSSFCCGVTDSFSFCIALRFCLGGSRGQTTSHDQRY